MSVEACIERIKAAYKKATEEAGVTSSTEFIDSLVNERLDKLMKSIESKLGKKIQDMTLSEKTSAYKEAISVADFSANARINAARAAIISRKNVYDTIDQIKSNIGPDFSAKEAMLSTLNLASKRKEGAGNGAFQIASGYRSQFMGSIDNILAKSGIDPKIFKATPAEPEKGDAFFKSVAKYIEAKDLKQELPKLDHQTKIFAEELMNHRDLMFYYAQRAGSPVLKLNGWSFPIHMDADRAAAMKDADFLALCKQTVDYDRMFAGSPLVSPADRDAYLLAKKTQAAANLTNIESDLSSYFQLMGKRKNIAEQIAAHREFAFKSTDAMLDFNKKMSDKNLLESLVLHGNQLAGKIALMEKFGGNPAEGASVVFQEIAKEHPEISEVKGLMTDMFRKVQKPTQGQGSGVAASIAAGSKSVATTVQLGNFVLSAMSDHVLSMATQTASGVGLFKSMASIPEYLAGLIPGVSKRQMARLGLSAEEGVHMMLDDIGDHIEGKGWAAKYFNTMAKFNLIKPEIAAKKSVALRHVADTIGDHVDTPYGELTGNFKNTLLYYGIKESDWNQAKNLFVKDADGNTMIDRGQLFVKDKGDLLVNKTAAIAYSKFSTMLTAIGDMSSTTPDAYDRAILQLGGENPEGVRAFQSMILMYMSSAMKAARTVKGMFNMGGLKGALYGTSTCTALLAAGYVAYVAKQYSSGKTPESFMKPDGTVNAKLLTNIVGSAGIAGIYWDLLTGLVSDKSPVSAGPVYSELQKLGIEASKAVQAAYNGDSDKAKMHGAAMWAWSARALPAANTFYGKSIMDMALVAPVANMISTDYTVRQQAKLEKKGQTKFTAPLWGK